MKLYYIARTLVTWAFTFYFKKINYAGGENIPKDKPTILSVNHPTGFFEPMLIGCTFPEHEFSFITRGDFFQKPLVSKVLQDANMIPIFRFRDGYADMKKNSDSMLFVNEALAENKKIMIFSEGTTETIRFLRPLQKGFARMAFDNYVANGDLDLQIVPVCLSYSEPHTARSEVYIKVGEAIPLRGYYEMYAESAPRAVQQLTKDTEDAMRPLILQIDDNSREITADNFFKLYLNTYPEQTYPIYKPSSRRLEAQQDIAKYINHLSTSAFSGLKQRIENYDEKIKSLNLNDTDIATSPRLSLGFLFTIILGFVPYLLGKYLHIIPLKIGAWMRDNKVKYKEFLGPVYAVTVLVATVAQYFLLLIIACFVGKAFLFSIVIALPFLAMFAINYKPRLKQFFGYFRLRKISEENKKKLSEERRELLKEVFR